MKLDAKLCFGIMFFSTEHFAFPSDTILLANNSCDGDMNRS